MGFKFKPFAKAGGWLLLFVVSSVAVIFSVGAFGIATDNEYIVGGLVAYEFCMEAVAGSFPTDDIIRHGYLLQAANFTMVLLFLSYIPVLAVSGVKAYRNRESISLPKPMLVLFVCFAAAAINLALEGVALALAPLVPESESNMLEFAMMLATGGSPYATIIISGILAPVVEELVLRQGVQKSLQEINPVFAIVAASAIFGVLHGNLVQGVFAGIFGLALGYVYYKTGNLAYSIAMHITVNLTGCIISIAALPEMPVYVGVALALGIAFAIANRIAPEKCELSMVMPVRFRYGS